MCNRCPLTALNINTNLGHICILLLFDYAEWRTWWFRAISRCRHRSSISGGYMRAFWEGSSLSLLCRFLRQTDVFLMNRLKFILFCCQFSLFFWPGVSPEMRQRAARLPSMETLAIGKQSSSRFLPKGGCKLISTLPLTYTYVCNLQTQVHLAPEN